MVIFGKWQGKPVTISTKHNSLTVSIEDHQSTSVFSFDKSGRLWTALVNRVSYRRGLNGSIVAKWGSGNEVLHRRWITDREKDDLLQLAHHGVHLLHRDISNGNFQTGTPITPDLSQELYSIANIGLEFYHADINRYLEIYKPVGILPPDQYMSVVLQLTEGCSFNTCTFCTFYRDRPFRIKSLQEFDSHIAAITDYLGEGLNIRRTIFLGDANALVTPMSRLLPLLEIVHKRLDVERLGGLYAFLDGFSGEKKSFQDYQALKSLGLEKVYIGLESGNNELLKFLRKPGTAEDALAAVHEIKKAGISVAVIILLGAGGRQFGQQHIRDSIDILNRMNLDADDIIYFSELIENEGLEYTNNAVQAKLSPLTPQERIQQGETISTRLSFSKRGTPHISRYDIRDFVY